MTAQGIMHGAELPWVNNRQEQMLGTFCKQSAGRDHGTEATDQQWGSGGI
jgi:hypothetical protein